MRARSVVVVVPLGRPGFLSNVLDNFRRQNVDAKRLVIVENGPAMGACRAQGLVPDALLTSASRPGLARNEGLAWVRQRGGGFVCCWDDDDYYGPQYLAEALDASDHAEAVGKCAVYVQTQAGTLRFFEQLGENRLTDYIAGPTISGWSEAMPDFGESRRGEDAFWCCDVIQSGARIYATSRHHFLQRRYCNPSHGHAWRVTDDQMAQATLHPVHDVGPVDLDVVNGQRPEPFRRLVPKRERRPEDHPDWKPSSLSFTPEELTALFAEAPCL